MLARAARKLPSGIPIRAFSQAWTPTVHKLPPLKHEYHALEPVISGTLLEIHHAKHHQAYVNNLNAGLEQFAEAEHKGDIAKQTALVPALNFNAGGHVNHSFFWNNLTPVKEGGGILEGGPLAKMIDRDFGSLDAFIAQFNATTVAVQGSGWGWLVFNKPMKRLEIATKPNQEVIGGPLAPLLTVDVWEHAYYLDYQNMRPNFLKEIWKVIDWKAVEAKFAEAV